MYDIDFSHPVSVHFIGIGGISMSGLAEILLSRKFHVTGSDNKASAITERLSSLGVEVKIPQAAENVSTDTDIFVYTAAIHPDNPEFAAAKATGKPMLTRAELLGAIMKHFSDSVTVAGTHGKTSTTGMVSHILLEHGDPTISIGGILPAINSNIRVGTSELFVAEACEYTNSYHSFFPKYNIILNVEEDHMDFFKDLDDIRRSFRKFAENTAADGVLAINGAIPDLSFFTEGLPCKVVTFGLSEDFDCHAVDIRYNEKGLPSFVPVLFGEKLPRVTLHVPGEHNVSNALSAIAITRSMGIATTDIINGLAKFSGANRRFQFKGTLANGAVIIDDYAHHPTEIRSCLTAAKNYPHKRLIVMFQPHTYTRTKAFLKEFGEALAMADLCILAPVYAAREKDEYGVSSRDVQEQVRSHGTDCLYFDTFDEIESWVQKNSLNGDLLITMGAGDIVNVGEALLA